MDWREKVAEYLDLHYLTFLDMFEDEIDGPNRAAKRKKVRREYEKQQKQNKKKNKKFKTQPVAENLYKNEFNASLDNTSEVKFGVISDTHMNSKYSQLTHLNNFYDICEKRGITSIYHAGDIDEGHNMRVGHIYENYKQGADQHIEEIIKNYPYREGITTHFICGNHDASFMKSSGLDIGKQISNKRKDMHYLGRDNALVHITDKITMLLKHPWSGSAYALSYRPQKIVEAMETSCLAKPDILCIGHFHKLEYLFYHGVHCFQTGCFQSSTPFTEGKGISVSMGGWIITLNIDKDTGELKSIIPELIPYNVAIENDYLNFS